MAGEDARSAGYVFASSQCEDAAHCGGVSLTQQVDDVETGIMLYYAVVGAWAHRSLPFYESGRDDHLDVCLRSSLTLLSCSS